jgi:V/A-type H+-transporting ATPase subunit F
VVTRPGDGAGFRLTGVPVDEVEPGEEAARFRVLVADPSVAVLAIETGVFGAVPEALVRQASARPFPVVLPFTLPRPSDAGAGRAYVAALIRRAIGYHVKLEERR